MLGAYLRLEAVVFLLLREYECEDSSSCRRSNEYHNN